MILISSYGVVTGMEEAKNEGKMVEKHILHSIKTSENQAYILAGFARSKNITDSDRVYALQAAEWLMNQRNDIDEQGAWLAFVERFVSNIEKSLTYHTPVALEKLEAVMDAVRQVYALQPGDDCSESLVNRIQEAVGKIEQ